MSQIYYTDAERVEIANKEYKNWKADNNKIG